MKTYLQDVVLLRDGKPVPKQEIPEVELNNAIALADRIDARGLMGKHFFWPNNTDESRIGLVSFLPPRCREYWAYHRERFLS